MQNGKISIIWVFCTFSDLPSALIRICIIGGTLDVFCGDRWQFWGYTCWWLVLLPLCWFDIIDVRLRIVLRISLLQCSVLSILLSKWHWSDFRIFSHKLIMISSLEFQNFVKNWTNLEISVQLDIVVEQYINFQWILLSFHVHSARLAS